MAKHDPIVDKIEPELGDLESVRDEIGEEYSRGIESRPPAPFGLKILGWLCGIGGLGLAAAAVVDHGKLMNALNVLNLSATWVIVQLVAQATVSLLAAIGIWVRHVLGWVFASGLLVHGMVLGTAQLLYASAAVGDIWEGTAPGLAPGYRSSAAIAVHLLLFLYLYRGSVLAYFSLERKPALAYGGLWFLTLVPLLLLT